MEDFSKLLGATLEYIRNTLHGMTGTLHISRAVFVLVNSGIQILIPLKTPLPWEMMASALSAALKSTCQCVRATKQKRKGGTDQSSFIVQLRDKGPKVNKQHWDGGKN